MILHRLNVKIKTKRRKNKPNLEAMCVLLQTQTVDISSMVSEKMLVWQGHW